MLTSLAVVLVGVWLIVSSQERVSADLTLILGIVAAILALVDLIRPYWHRESPG